MTATLSDRERQIIREIVQSLRSAAATMRRIRPAQPSKLERQAHARGLEHAAALVEQAAEK
jgi:hypothetical protein